MKIQTVLPLLFSYASASNPFSSNVVLLTEKNWAELEKSPHLWLVNGYCLLSYCLARCRLLRSPLLLSPLRKSTDDTR